MIEFVYVIGILITALVWKCKPHFRPIANQEQLVTLTLGWPVAAIISMLMLTVSVLKHRARQ